MSAVDNELPPRETLSRTKTPKANLDFFFVEESYKTSKEHTVSLGRVTVQRVCRQPDRSALVCSLQWITDLLLLTAAGAQGKGGREDQAVRAVRDPDPGLVSAGARHEDRSLQARVGCLESLPSAWHPSHVSVVGWHALPNEKMN